MAARRHSMGSSPPVGQRPRCWSASALGRRLWCGATGAGSASVHFELRGGEKEKLAIMLANALAALRSAANAECGLSQSVRASATEKAGRRGSLAFQSRTGSGLC